MRALAFIAVLGLSGPAYADVVETRRGLDVYTEPAKSWKNSRGRVMRKARFEVHERARGTGCKDEWLRIDDRAWICSTHTRPTDEPAGGPVWPEVKDGADLPGTFVVTRDAVAYPTLAKAAARAEPIELPGQGGYKYRGKRRHRGVDYVKIDLGWVPAAQAKVVRTIDFGGVRLPADARGKRLAFVGPKDAPVYDARGKRTGERIDAQTYLGTIGNPVDTGDRKLVAVDGSRNVRARDIRVVTWAPPPEVADDERWIDVDMTEQILVAYRGTTPVLATLVSTARTRTPVGEFRIEKKRPYSRMRSKPHYRTKWDTYAPWVISVKGRIAIHAVYWHQDFGKARSQGCVNVAPRDAKFLWDWTEPALPPGWVRIESDERDRPTLVRIRRSPKRG